MRILHVLPSINPLLGGPSHAIFPMCHALVKQGLDVHILSTTDGLDADLPTIRESGRYHDIPTTLTSPLPFKRKEFIPSYAMYQWLQKNISDFDVVSLHYLFTFSTTCAAWCARRKKVPYTVRTIGHCAPWSLAQQRTLKQYYLSAFDKTVLRKASGIHATSAGEADDIRSLVDHPNIATIPLGIELEDDPNTISIRKDFVIPADHSILLYLSRIHPKKRLDHLMQALLEVPYPCSVLIAGSGDSDYVQSLKRQAEKLPKHIQIKFLGHVTGAMKQALLHQSDVYVLPSYAENFSIATVEAMGAGLPVLIGEGVQIAPLIHASHSGLVVNEHLSSLTKALLQILEDKKLRLEMSENARRYVRENLVWEVVGQRLAAFYESVAENPI